MIDPRCGMNTSRGTVRPGRRMGSGRSVPAGLPIGRVPASMCVVYGAAVVATGWGLASWPVGACSLIFFALAATRRRTR